MFDLIGKTALVTGGSRGLGRAIAIAFARQGADVAINYRGNAEAAEAVTTEITALGRRALAIQGDTSGGRESCEAIVKAAIDGLGSVDILVNNAGITRDNLLVRMDADEWDAVIGTNLSGPFWMTRAIARPMMKARKGRIKPGDRVLMVAFGAGYTAGAALLEWTADPTRAFLAPGAQTRMDQPQRRLEEAAV